jgi:hypothetical protein
VNTVTQDQTNFGIYYKNNPPYVQVVKLTSDRIPAASFSAFGAVSNLTAYVATRPRYFTTAPYVNTAADNEIGIFKTNSFVSCDDLNKVHFAFSVHIADLDTSSTGLRIPSTLVFRVRCCL